MFNRSDGRGATIWTEADGSKKARDNFSCAHCNRNQIIDPGMSATDMGGWCYQCAKAVCKLCATGPCIPLAKRIEAMENRERSLRSILGY